MMTISAVALMCAACATSAPLAGQTRSHYSSYGTQRIAVVCLELDSPASAIDADLRMQVSLPQALHLNDSLESTHNRTTETANVLEHEVIQKLQAQGYITDAVTSTIASASALQSSLDTLAEQGFDALFIVRYIAVEKVSVAVASGTEQRTISSGRMADAPRSIQVTTYKPKPYTGMLLLARAQLIDTRSGIQLFLSPEPRYSVGDVIPPDSPLLRWGRVLPDLPTFTATDARYQACATVATRLIQRLPPATAKPRSIDLQHSKSVAVVEDLEARTEWQLSLLGQAAVILRPIALDLGPANALVPQDAQRKFVLSSQNLGTAYAGGGGVQLAWRWQRLALVAQLYENYVPGIASRTYVRTDPYAARAFPLTVGPAHDVGVDVFVGHLRMVNRILGCRVGIGPSLRLRYANSTSPSGSQLDELGLAAGVASFYEVFARLGDLEAGMVASTALAYDFVQAPYMSGGFGFRFGINL